MTDLENIDIKADILLMTATEVEIRAVINYVTNTYHKECRNIPTKNITFYDLGIIGGARIMLARSGMGSKGVRGSSQTLTEAIEIVSPQFVIAVGIAFGVDDEKQEIGDVLVSNQLHLYELQKVHKTGRIIPRGDKSPASITLIDRCEDGALSWGSSICTIRQGLILSGDKLVDNVDYRESLKINFGEEAIGGEMEGTGIYEAAERKNVDWIIIKAICDWGDGNKSKDKRANQELAANNATQFVFHVIERGGLSSSRTEGELDSTLLEFGEEAKLLTEKIHNFRNSFFPHVDKIVTFSDISSESSNLFGQIANWTRHNSENPKTNAINGLISSLHIRIDTVQTEVINACSNATKKNTFLLDKTLERLSTLLDILQKTLSH